MEKREKIKFYFTKANKVAIPFILLSGVFFIISLFGMFSSLTEDYSSNDLAIAVPMFLIFATPFVAILIHNNNQNKKEALKPSDSQMDSWLEEDIQSIIISRPYDKLGISKEDLVAESLLVVGPVYWNIGGFDVIDILMKKGKDGINRYSIWTIQVFAFTENYLCSYKCHYNWIKNTYINESTNEFFYKDVVSVKTDTVSSAYTLMNGERLVHSEAFQLKLVGDEITIITNDASLNTSSVMVSKAEKAVQSIRAMLRDKKK